MTSATQKVDSGGHVSRGDIEAKLREIRGEADVAGQNAKQYALIGGAVVAVAVVALAFAWGKRRGKKRTTVVEVRRV
jgi:hypothetical protein